MTEDEEHFLTLEDFKAKYADAREAALFTSVVLDAQKPHGNDLLNLLEMLTKFATLSTTLRELDDFTINELKGRLTKLEEVTKQNGK